MTRWSTAWSQDRVTRYKRVDGAETTSAQLVLIARVLRHKGKRSVLQQESMCDELW